MTNQLLEQWRRSFIETIVVALTGSENADGPLWTHEEAVQVAVNEFEALTEKIGEFAIWSIEEDAADSARECMSYWGDGE